MSQTPRHERFIAFTTTAGEGTEADLPSLVLNPRAIASIELCDNRTSISISLISGVEHRIEGLLRPQARKLLRDLISGLGEKSVVPLPEGATIPGRRIA